jgi:hypothetical protein
VATDKGMTSGSVVGADGVKGGGAFFSQKTTEKGNTPYK